MKKKEILDDLVIHLDPKPLTKEEELGLSLFIRQLKKRKAQPRTPSKQNLRHKVAQI